MLMFIHFLLVINVSILVQYKLFAYLGLTESRLKRGLWKGVDFFCTEQDRTSTNDTEPKVEPTARVFASSFCQAKAVSPSCGSSIRTKTKRIYMRFQNKCVLILRIPH